MERKLNAKLIKNILDAYEEKYEYILPEELELNENQEQFLRGYLYAQANKEKIDEKDGGDEIRQRILKVRSKYCERILELLFSEGEIYHGELADKLNLSPSGLNAIIKKMQEGDTYLIDMMQIGKYKIYMLPDEVKKYMERKEYVDRKEYAERKEYHIDKEEKDLINSSDLILGLQHFVELAGSDWKDVLSLLLLGEDTDIDEKIKNKFTELMAQIQWTKKCNEDSLEDLYRVIKNDILVSLVNEYLDELKKCESIIKKEIGQQKNGKRLMRHVIVK